MSKHDSPGICPCCGRANLPPAKINLCGDIVDVVRHRTDLTYAQIAEAFHVSEKTVKRYARRAGIKRKRGSK